MIEFQTDILQMLQGSQYMKYYSIVLIKSNLKFSKTQFNPIYDTLVEKIFYPIIKSIIYDNLNLIKINCIFIFFYMGKK